MFKYFKIHSEKYSNEHFFRDDYEEDFWISEEKFRIYSNELQLELKDQEITGEFSKRFCAEQYYGDPKDMFEISMCNNVYKVNANNFEEELLKFHICLWMVEEITEEEYISSKSK